MSQYFAQVEANELKLRVALDEKLLKRCLDVIEEHYFANSGSVLINLVTDLRGRLEINSGELK